MEYILKVNGIDCANCASKIENKINKIKGVADASVNFMTGKVFIETKDVSEEELEKILTEAKSIIKKIEPDSVIEE